MAEKKEYHNLKKFLKVPNDPEGDYFMYLLDKYRIGDFKYRIFYTPSKEKMKKFKNKKFYGSFRDCGKKYADHGRLYIRFAKSDWELSQDKHARIFREGFFRLERLCLHLKDRLRMFSKSVGDDIDNELNFTNQELKEARK